MLALTSRARGGSTLLSSALAYLVAFSNSGFNGNGMAITGLTEVVF